MTEKERHLNILERNPFYKTRSLIKNKIKLDNKDDSLIQFIYYMIENENRKGVSLQTLKENPDFEILLSYVGE